jgi:hypothetical protein
MRDVPAGSLISNPPSVPTVTQEGKSCPGTTDQTFAEVSTALAGNNVLRSRLRASAAPATGRAVALNARSAGGWNVFGFSAPAPTDRVVPIHVFWAAKLSVRLVGLFTLTTVVPTASPSPKSTAPLATPCVLATFTVALPPTIETPVSIV